MSIKEPTGIDPQLNDTNDGNEDQFVVNQGVTENEDHSAKEIKYTPDQILAISESASYIEGAANRIINQLQLTENIGFKELSQILETQNIFNSLITEISKGDADLSKIARLQKLARQVVEFAERNPNRLPDDVNLPKLTAKLRELEDSTQFLRTA